MAVRDVLSGAFDTVRGWAAWIDQELGAEVPLALDSQQAAAETQQQQAPVDTGPIWDFGGNSSGLLIAAAAGLVVLVLLATR